MKIDEKIELSALLEVSRRLTSSFDIKRNLRDAMEILSRYLDMQRGCIFLFDRDTGILEIISAYGLTEEEIRRGKYRIGEGIVGKVIKTGLPMFIPNIEEEPEFLNKTCSRIKKSGISFLCVPVKINEEIMGVLSVDRIYSEKHGDVRDDLRVLEVVASMIAQYLKLWDNYRKVKEEKEILGFHLKERFNPIGIIGESQAIRSVIKNIIKIAPTDATVLILGETGTGKEFLAKTVHFQSKRSKGPFVVVNCAAIPETLIEVELFGSEKGAFTGAVKRKGRFESAHNGTIFLDEIGELPMNIQPKLLRVIQEKTIEPLGSSKSIKVDVRIIAATNRELYHEVLLGNFREDLYWRLNVITIQMPPLRKRPEDIPYLIDHFLNKYNKQYHKSLTIDDEVMDILYRYQFPGNVRELENLIERLVIMVEESIIKKKHLPGYIMNPVKPMSSQERIIPDNGVTLREEIIELEKARIIDALKKNNMVIRKAAKHLGITERQLGYRIKKYQIRLKNL